MKIFLVWFDLSTLISLKKSPAALNLQSCSEFLLWISGVAWALPPLRVSEVSKTRGVKLKKSKTPENFPPAALTARKLRKQGGKAQKGVKLKELHWCLKDRRSGDLPHWPTMFGYNWNQYGVQFDQFGSFWGSSRVGWAFANYNSKIRVRSRIQIRKFLNYSNCSLPGMRFLSFEKLPTNLKLFKNVLGCWQTATNTSLARVPSSNTIKYTVYTGEMPRRAEKMEVIRDS